MVVRRQPLKRRAASSGGRRHRRRRLHGVVIVSSWQLLPAAWLNLAGRRARVTCISAYLRAETRARVDSIKRNHHQRIARWRLRRAVACGRKPRRHARWRASSHVRMLCSRSAAAAMAAFALGEKSAARITALFCLMAIWHVGIGERLAPSTAPRTAFGNRPPCHHLRLRPRARLIIIGARACHWHSS